MNSNWWMVRAGKNANLIDDFLEQGIVTIGGTEIGNLSEFSSYDDVLSRVKQTHVNWKTGKQRMWASQIFRFAHAVKLNDRILSYNPESRSYHIGKVISNYKYSPNVLSDHPNVRNVEWIGTLERDLLSTKAKNSLGAISSLFQVPSEVGEEIESCLHSPRDTVKKPIDSFKNESSLFEDAESMETRSIESIKDLISQLDWEELQELVAGVLRAMGYKTQISPKGADRGKDIIASPDGFGFESPRILVEVKHREGSSIGSQAIRSFFGGKHKDDKGLYVSTGGFTKDARYEAERANIPMTLWSLDELVRAIITHYEKLDIETKQLIPLRRIYWPINSFS